MPFGLFHESEWYSWTWRLVNHGYCCGWKFSSWHRQGQVRGKGTYTVRKRSGIWGQEQRKGKLKRQVGAALRTASWARTENVGFRKTTQVIQGFQEGAGSDIYHQLYILGDTFWKKLSGQFRRKYREIRSRKIIGETIPIAQVRGNSGLK